MGGRSSGSGAATSVTTRRKSEEGVAGGNTKKSKQEASHKASPPKVRNREKIRDELANCEAKALSPELLSKHSDDFVSNLLSIKCPK